MSGALDLHELSDQPRWVSWHEVRKRGELPKKLPFGAKGEAAEANNPATWLTRPAAEHLRSVRAYDGIGIMLGVLPAGPALCGIDLDSSLDDEGNLAPWAHGILSAVHSYTEISPSGHGLKSWFLCSPGDARTFLTALGVPSHQFGTKRSIGGNGALHGPAVEIYCSHRYFTVTERTWIGCTDEIVTLDLDSLLALVPLVPAAARANGTGSGDTGDFNDPVDESELGRKLAAALGRYPKLRKRWLGSTEGLTDTSRSAIDFSLAALLKRAGFTAAEMRVALIRNEYGAGREKADDERYFSRIWANTSTPEQPQPKVAGLPTIVVQAGKRMEAADAALAAMVANGTEFYQRDRSLVRTCTVKAKSSDGAVVPVHGVVGVTLPYLSRAMGKAANWLRANKDGELLSIDPPKDVAEQVLSMVGEWPFPPLAGVIGTPTMRPDGSLLLAAGYDKQTGLVLVAPPSMPAIPDHPTYRDAREALNILVDLLQEFPFADKASNAVGVSMLMTPVLRGALYPAVPMHVAAAPQSGSGKSYLQDLASFLATGERCAVITVSTNPDETEKRLIGAALAGYPILALDNCNGVLAGDFLAQVSERPLLQLRPLGTSEQVRIANVFSLFANGNNIQIHADLVRRSVLCTIDANSENPETRTFDRDPLAELATGRGPYLAACLTIARAYIVAGYPGRLTPIPSFERWSDLVRSALVWLGLDDPCGNAASLRADDPQRSARARIFAAWTGPLSLGDGYTATEIIAAADAWDGELGRLIWPEFRAALFDVAKLRGTEKIDPTRLGLWLLASSRVVVGGRKLLKQKGANTKWSLVTL